MLKIFSKVKEDKWTKKQFILPNCHTKIISNAVLAAI